MSLTSPAFIKYLDIQNYRAIFSKITTETRRKTELNFGNEIIELYYKLKSTMRKPRSLLRKYKIPSFEPKISELGMLLKSKISNKDLLDNQLFENQKIECHKFIQFLNVPIKIEKNPRPTTSKPSSRSSRPFSTESRKQELIKKALFGPIQTDRSTSLIELNRRLNTSLKISNQRVIPQSGKASLIKFQKGLSAASSHKRSRDDSNQSKHTPNDSMNKQSVKELVENIEDSSGDYKTDRQKAKDLKVGNILQKEFKQIKTVVLRPLSALHRLKIEQTYKKIKKDTDPICKTFDSFEIEHLSDIQARILYFSKNNDLESLEKELSHVRKGAADFRANHLCSPLHYAVKNGNHQMVRLLLEHGANPNRELKNGEIALHEACRLGRKDVT